MIINYKKTSNSEPLIKTKTLEAGTWVYVTKPNLENIGKLAKNYGLDPALVQDALDPFESPRMEIEDTTIYVFATIPHAEKAEVIITVPILMALGSNFIATVSTRDLPFLDKFKEGRVVFNTNRKTKLFTQFLKEIISLYNYYLLDINKKVRKISAYPGRITEEDISQFVLHEEVLNTFISDLSPIEKILKNLLTGDFVNLAEDDSELIEDIMLSTQQLIETCRLTLTNIVNIRGAYATIVTNNLNKIIKILPIQNYILDQ